MTTARLMYEATAANGN